MTEVGSALAPFVEMALASIHREYPWHLVHVATRDADVRPPRELNPAFFGSFDWHSAVHGHWCVARGLRLAPDAPFADRARRALGTSLTSARIAGEVAYFRAEGHVGFERPYGLAWVLQLAAELREWGSDEAGRWLAALMPLETLAMERLAEWLPRLSHPIRSGEHAQSAFAMGLALDWARTAGATEFAHGIERRAREFHGADVAAPIAYEPSGHDFLSPALGEADLMRRVLEAPEFASWLTGFVPDWESPAARRWLTPVTPADRSDGKLSHLDGLNLSRAWMLEGIAGALPAGDPRRAALAGAASRHRAAGLDGAASEHYAGSHWLGSFAMYLATSRGRADVA